MKLLTCSSQQLGTKQSRKFQPWLTLEELTFNEIGEVIKRNIRPEKSLFIAKTTKFLETRQRPDEPIVHFLHRLKERTIYCEFERLATGEITTEDELIMLRWIEGMPGRCQWCNGYRRRKWTRRHEFKSWTRLIALHIALMPLGKVWIQLFSLQLWVNSRAD